MTNNQRQRFNIQQWAKSHFRASTCAEVECDGYIYGWITKVPPGSPQANYIRTNSGREFTETRIGEAVTQFYFPPGQRCFASDQHVWQVREPTATRTLLDRHGNPARPQRFTRGEDFNGEFNEEMYLIQQARKRG